MQGWYNARVLSRTGDEIRVHYMNWAEKFDSNICVDDVTLIPYTTRTKEHHLTKRKKPDLAASVATATTTTAAASISLDQAPNALNNSTDEIDSTIRSTLNKSIIEETAAAAVEVKAADEEVETGGPKRSSRLGRAGSLPAIPIKKEKINTACSNEDSNGAVERGGVEVEDRVVGIESAGEATAASSSSDTVKDETDAGQSEKVPKMLKGREYGAGEAEHASSYLTNAFCVQKYYKKYLINCCIKINSIQISYDVLSCSMFLTSDQCPIPTVIPEELLIPQVPRGLAIACLYVCM